MTNKSNLEY